MTAGARSGCRTIGGRLGATLFFSVFLLMGLAFVAMMLAEAVRQTAVWLWPSVPCTVIASGVEETGDDEDPYRPSICFEYEVDGRSYTSRTLRRGATATASYDRARRPADRHPAGSRTACRVNPDFPGEAVLERRLPTVALVALFPLIFVAVGGGGIWGVWRGWSGGEADQPPAPISERARGIRNLGRRIELVAGLFFTAIGGGLTIGLLALPVARLVAAAAWTETPATVVASTVRSWSTDDGTSYRADVLYEYSAGGRTWRSNRRTFFPMSPSGHDGSRAVVARHPEDAAVDCFVDPDDPSRSVLDRQPLPEYLIGLFPLAFLGAGLAVSVHAAKRRPPTVPGALDDSAATRVLRPAAGPITKVVGMTLIAAFWNGIVGVFVWQLVESFRAGSPSWFLGLFLIPFVVIGFGLIAGIGHTALAAFNPRPRLELSPASPRLGDRLGVSWSFAGAAGRIQRLTLAIEGHEKATYRRGTDTQTDREAFASFDLVDTTAAWQIARGSAEVTIPEDTMHSFSSDSNAVVWALVVHGEIARWPDVLETYEIEVRPLPPDRLLP